MLIPGIPDRTVLSVVPGDQGISNHIGLGCWTELIHFPLHSFVLVAFDMMDTQKWEEIIVGCKEGDDVLIIWEVVVILVLC